MTFMDLEDPDYAYMFGFLQADGHLTAGHGRKGRLTVELSHRDAAILGEFQRLTPYNSTITERTRGTNFSASHHSATWTLCSLQARTTLIQLGLPSGRKARRIAPPRVPFSRADYLRGLVDADGSVGFTADGFPFVSLTTSSTAIAAYLCHYVKSSLGIHRVAGRNTRDGVYTVMYAREAAVAVAEHLYSPTSIALARKRAIADKITSWVRPDHMSPARTRRPWTPTEERVLLETPDLRSTAERLNRSYRSCQSRRWRLLQSAARPI
ncbi:LAGLIDADG family homing endonuclease [Streptomyces sp. CA-252508]|uniref:LAGLIDADG family homing endonuclease n=1 Tax=Streptomyces sp. CA-252508 TaxID=3418946 RepID=UPI003D941C6B